MWASISKQELKEKLKSYHTYSTEHNAIIRKHYTIYSTYNTTEPKI
jgi:hypothetical protein